MRIRLAALGVLIVLGSAVPRPAEAFKTLTFAAGPFRYVVQTGFVSAGATDSFSAICPAGFQGTGAGAKLFAPPPKDNPGNMWITGARPGGNGADVSARDVTGAGEQFNGTAICLRDPSFALAYATASSTTSANTSLQVIAPCTSLGDQIIGGGGASTQPTETDDVASFPQPGGARGQVGWNFDATHSGSTSTTMVSRVVCLPPNTRNVKDIHSETVLDESSTKSEKAKCPSTFHVAAGGAQIAFGDLIASAPFDGGDADKAPDDGWAVTVRNRTDTPEVLRAWAICVK